MTRFIIASLGVLALVYSCKEEQKPSFAQTSLFEMAAPKVMVDSTLFTTQAQVILTPAVTGSQIRYSLDGASVDEDSPLYTGPLTIAKSATLQYKAFHNDLQPSEQKEIELAQIKSNISHANITISPQPKPPYQGQGPQALVDLQKGNLSFRSDKRWMGFQAPSINIHLTLPKKMVLSNIVVSGLEDQGSWIFAPENIQIHANGKAVGQMEQSAATKNGSPAIQYWTIPIEHGTYETLDITLNALSQIPEWHDGSGTLPWLFIDEILVQ